MTIDPKNLLLSAIDLFFNKWPQPFPGRHRLHRCRIISHRGEHDNFHVLENTLPAFEGVREAGVWGVELDIRWTRDLEPVVFHDPGTDRIFGQDRKIRRMTLAELKSRFPLIPSLAEVIAGFGRSLHLMVEIKAEPYPDPAFQNRRLASLFSGLNPGQDYHLLSLTPGMFRFIDFVPSTFLLPIAGTDIGSLSRLALRKGYGGITGHYLLLHHRMIRQHRRYGQKVGTGFVASKNALYREVNRGVDWIFSNRAAKLQAYCRSYDAKG